MSKNKLILIDKSKSIEDGLDYISRTKGETSICFTMALGYIAKIMCENKVAMKKVTDTLKSMIKENEESDENGKN